MFPYYCFSMFPSNKAALVVLIRSGVRNTAAEAQQKLFKDWWSRRPAPTGALSGGIRLSKGLGGLLC